MFTGNAGLLIDAVDVGAKPDDDEFLEIKYVPVEELLKKCLSGEIEDGKTIVAVLKYFALKK